MRSCNHCIKKVKSFKKLKVLMKVSSFKKVKKSLMN